VLHSYSAKARDLSWPAILKYVANRAGLNQFSTQGPYGTAMQAVISRRCWSRRRPCRLLNVKARVASQRMFWLKVQKSPVFDLRGRPGFFAMC
jgi:hypothetical protein